jgi:serine/threonine protein kinase
MSHMQTHDELLNQKRFDYLSREIVLLEMFNSEHLIAFYELVLTKSNFYVFIEYCNGGSLGDLLLLKGRFSELVSRNILY